MSNQCNNTRCIPRSPAVSRNNNTQNPAIQNMPILANTGKALSSISSEPPSMGAIMPPLQKKTDQGMGHRRGGRLTYIRDNAEAIPHAVPRTIHSGQWEARLTGRRDIPRVPKISGVHLNSVVLARHVL